MSTLVIVWRFEPCITPHEGTDRQYTCAHADAAVIMCPERDLDSQACCSSLDCEGVRSVMLRTLRETSRRGVLRCTWHAQDSYPAADVVCAKRLTLQPQKAGILHRCEVIPEMCSGGLWDQGKKLLGQAKLSGWIPEKL